MEELKQRVKKVIAVHFGIKEEQIIDNETFADQNGFTADSLDLIELMMEIEEEFDIMILDENADDLHTVDDYVKYLSKVVK